MEKENLLLNEATTHTTEQQHFPECSDPILPPTRHSCFRPKLLILRHCSLTLSAHDIAAHGQDPVVGSMLFIKTTTTTKPYWGLKEPYWGSEEHLLPFQKDQLSAPRAHVVVHGNSWNELPGIQDPPLVSVATKHTCGILTYYIHSNT